MGMWKATLFTAFVVWLMSCVGFAVADDVIRVNFQEAGNPQPLRTGTVHLEDTGENYGDRGNGYAYGWSSDNTGEGRRRYSIGDCRLDGHVRMNGKYWEITLADGSYLVNIAFGDPGYTAEQDFKIEGVTYNDPDGSDNFDIHENLSVTVSGGELKVEELSGNPKLCYIEIVDASIGFPAKQTFPAEDTSMLAFPTAEGAGRHITGGRGGDVYHVTNLDTSGPGSFSWGISSVYGNHPRTIVFDIGGHITVDSSFDGDYSFSANNITIAGQTAPGKGITFRDRHMQITNSENIIMRYLRLRLGDENRPNTSNTISRDDLATYQPQPTDPPNYWVVEDIPGEPDNVRVYDTYSPDVLTINYVDGIILDHMSITWSVDSVIDTYGVGNMTMQWSIVGEPLHRSWHDKRYKGSQHHGLLGSWRRTANTNTLHHNLFVSSDARNPTLGANRVWDEDADAPLDEPDDLTVLSDFRNNVIYNLDEPTKFSPSRHNAVGNYYKWGPVSEKNKNGDDGSGEDTDDSILKGFYVAEESLPDTLADMTNNGFALQTGYLSGNYFYDTFGTSYSSSQAAMFNANNYDAIDSYDGITSFSSFYTDVPHTVPGYVPPVTTSAADAYTSVLAQAGASLVQDDIDARIVRWTESGIGFTDGHEKGLIDSPGQLEGWVDGDGVQVSGWDMYPTVTRPEDFDVDQDGMADAWEVSVGLDPSDPDDRNDDRNGDGYTNLEEYLEWLTGTLLVTVEATDDYSQEIDNDTATFTLIRQGDTVGYLPVYITVGGDAVYQEDYTISGSLVFYDGNKAYISIPTGQSEVSFTVHPINDFVFEGDESIVVTVEPDLSNNYELGDTILATAYIYDVSGTDLTDFVALSQFWQDSCGGDSDCQSVDFDSSGSLNSVDLEKFAMRWLSEKGAVEVPFDPILINFQPSDSTVPAGYLMDAGYAYGDRGNGYTYGWDEDISGHARDRDEHSDQRYDTLNHFEKSGTHYWELEIPNGDYAVKLVTGDPDYADSINDVQIEDVLLNDPDGEDNFDEYVDINVTVTDGRLTVTQQSSGDSAKICFIEIR